MKPGLYDDISADEYHSERAFGDLPPLLSASTAHTLESRSPAHAHLYHPRLGRRVRRATKAMDFGSIAHRLLLGKGAEYAVAEWSPPMTADEELTELAEAVAKDPAILRGSPNARPRAKRPTKADEPPPVGPSGVPEWSDWKRADARRAKEAILAASKIPLLPKEKRIADHLVRQIRHELDHFEIDLSGGIAEGVLYWRDRETGVHCRGMVDYFVPAQGTIFDLKCRRSAHRKAVQSSIYEDGCDMQAAAYLEAFEHLHPEYAGRFKFVFLFVEVGTGLLSPFEPSESFLTLGRARWNRAKARWAHCLRTDSWPGYVDRITTIEPADWMLRNEEDASIRHGEQGFYESLHRSRQDDPSHDEGPDDGEYENDENVF